VPFSIALSRQTPPERSLEVPSTWRVPRLWLLTAVVAVAGLIPTAGCRSPENAASGITVTWEVDPDPPRTGTAIVTVVLDDTLGRPVDGARVTVEGTMTHPGMAPTVAEGVEVSAGRYEARIDLSMAGDWVLLLNATMADGRSLQREKSLRGVRDP